MLLRILSEYFEAAGEVITRHGGTITQFQGDALLAGFNVPTDDNDHALHAINAATQLVALTQSSTFAGETLRVRIGINTGTVAAGTVGGGKRLTYTIHGESVNIAARLEQLNKCTGTQILLTAATANVADGKLILEPAGKFEIRGVDDPLELFSVS